MEIFQALKMKKEVFKYVSYGFFAALIIANEVISLIHRFQFFWILKYGRARQSLSGSTVSLLFLSIFNDPVKSVICPAIERNVLFWEMQKGEEIEYNISKVLQQDR